MGEIRDNWSKLEIVSKVIASILVPSVIFVIGQRFTKNTQQSDLLTSLITHLSSDSDDERLIAVEVINHLASHKQLPDEIVFTLVRIAKEDENPEVVIAASQSLEKINRLENADELFVLAHDPSFRIFIEIPSGQNLAETVKVLTDSLQARNSQYRVIGNPHTNDIIIPAYHQVIYYSPQSQSVAEDVANVVEGIAQATPVKTQLHGDGANTPIDVIRIVLTFPL